IELRRQGTGAWTALDTTVGSGTLRARFDRGQLTPGSYDLRATATDAAGNRTVATTFAGGGRAVVKVDSGVSARAPVAVSPAPAPVPQAAPPGKTPVRCAAKSKRPKHKRHKRHAAKHGRHRAKHHRRARKHRAKRTCVVGGEKTRHHHLGQKKTH